jgi:glutaminyl-tRNA synthetase
MEDPTKCLFLAIGLDPKVVDSTLKNKKVTQRLREVIELAAITEATKTIGNLLYTVATKMPETTFIHTKFLITQVLTENIQRPLQLDEAIAFLADLVRKSGAEASIDEAAFKVAAGVGIVVTDAKIESTIDGLFKENFEEIKEQGHTFDFNKIIYKANDLLKWAEKKKVMELINKTKADLLKDIPKVEGAKKAKKEAPAKTEQVAAAAATAEPETTTGKDIDDIIGRDIEAARNSEELLRKHREATGGRILTRFPPEPNGYLHIGHAKAMRFNFTFAKERGGQTYLRYDDTNPVKENQEFIDNIRNCVDWLGYKPFKITYASDYF